jgi:hypothetical protein
MTNTRFSASYVDSLLEQADWQQLVELAGIVMSAEGFDATKPTHGLPVALFALIETLSWWGAARSGSWTYYEATSVPVQERVWEALKRLAPPDLAGAYGDGMHAWRTPSQAAATDAWLEGNELRLKEWITQLCRTNRTEIHALA